VYENIQVCICLTSETVGVALMLEACYKVDLI